MCKYCEKGECLYYKKYDPVQAVYIEEDKTLSIDHPVSEFSVSIDIDYCPKCGRSLKTPR
ncbi:hypothetical protein [Clostridium tertium]|uniref:hypothetical protein n=1 Tax=Clostridium tertium TaxID=1559 RepID=UPI0023B34213|nr:hypothetical protein [Clostridium tertium]